MKKCTKLSISVILAFAIIMSYTIFFVSAKNMTEKSEDASPYYTTINNAIATFNISGLNSTSTAKLTSKRSTSLYIKIELQKEKSTGYQTIETWTKSGTGTYLSLEETRLINVFSDYRIKVTFTAGGETVVKTVYP